MRIRRKQRKDLSGCRECGVKLRKGAKYFSQGVCHKCGKIKMTFTRKSPTTQKLQFLRNCSNIDEVVGTALEPACFDKEDFNIDVARKVFLETLTRYAEVLRPSTISRMSRRDYECVLDYFGVDGRRELTYGELGKKYKITRAYAHNIVLKFSRRLYYIFGKTISVDGPRTSKRVRALDINPQVYSETLLKLEQEERLSNAQ